MNRALIDFLAKMEVHGYSASRLKQLRWALEMMTLYLREAHDIGDWRAVGESHLRGFAIYAAGRHQKAQGGQVSPGTLRQMLSSVRVFFRWMRKSGRLIHDPSEQLTLPRRGLALPRVLGELEIERLIETADTGTTVGIRDRALMETLYATGIRRGEAYKLDIYDVDTVAGWLVVREGKGRRDRIVPLGETACHWLARYITEARPELAGGLNRVKRRTNTNNPKSEIRNPQSKAVTSALWVSRRGRRMSYVMMAQRLRGYARQAGVRASLHSFRHSCATHLLRGGASIRHVQQLLGHRGLETTEIYTHVEIDDLKRVVDRVSQAETPMHEEE